MDVSWASISRKAISQEPLGVCTAGGSCRLDSAQVLMVPGLPDQEGTKCGDRQNRLRGTEQEQKARKFVQGSWGPSKMQPPSCPLFPLPDPHGKKREGPLSLPRRLQTQHCGSVVCQG